MLVRAMSSEQYDARTHSSENSFIFFFFFGRAEEYRDANYQYPIFFNKFDYYVPQPQGTLKKMYFNLRGEIHICDVPLVSRYPARFRNLVTLFVVKLTTGFL